VRRISPATAFDLMAGGSRTSLEPDAQETPCSYGWPGNPSEPRSVLVWPYRGCRIALARSNTLRSSGLPAMHRKPLSMARVAQGASKKRPSAAPSRGENADRPRTTLVPGVNRTSPCNELRSYGIEAAGPKFTFLGGYGSRPRASARSC
jgi:hypothetical protein